MKYQPNLSIQKKEIQKSYVINYKKRFVEADVIKLNDLQLFIKLFQSYIVIMILEKLPFKNV